MKMNQSTQFDFRDAIGEAKPNLVLWQCRLCRDVRQQVRTRKACVKSVGAGVILKTMS